MEEEVALMLEKIKVVLEEITKERVDPKIYTQILQEFCQIKKGELESLSHEILSKMGIKRVKTLVSLRLYRGCAYRILYKRMDTDAILFYGGLYMRGASINNMSAGSGRGNTSYWSEVALPRDVEFENFWGGHNGFFAQPKKGQKLGEENLDNTLWVWGVNSNGCLGVGSTNNIEIPKKITLPTRARKIVVGHSENIGAQSSLLLGEDGYVYGCGNNAYGELGIGNTIAPNSWTRCPSLENITDIALASNGSVGYAMAVGGEGELYTWGWGGGYALGNGRTDNILSPTKIIVSQKVKGIFPALWRSDSTYYQSSLILLEDGSLQGAGYNGQCMLSQSHTNAVQSFSAILDERGSPLLRIKKVSASSVYGTSFALSEEGDLYAWGYGNFGFGDSANLVREQKAKIRLNSVLDFQAVTDTGSTRCLAKVGENQYKAFGCNTDKGLGIGKTGNSYAWQDVVIPYGNLQEIAWQCFSGEGGLTAIIENEFYASGSTEYFVNFGTSTLQRQI